VLFKPKLVKLLAPHLRPDKKRISELEMFRVQFGIPHNDLAMRIMSSPSTTRRVQKQCLEDFRNQNPEASEEELFRMVLISRIQVPLNYGVGKDQYYGVDVDQAMESINSFDELCDYIIALDEQEPAFPDPLGIGKLIDEILAQEEIDKKVPAENLIKSLEQDYYALRKEHPNRDEHWFLANTLLKKYGSTQWAKQKGPELMKFIAYKDTNQFSILEPPKSIRGLALFLVWKEFGKQQAIYYNSEFNQIMEPIIKSKESNIFFDKYKERNLRTWKENQVEDNSPYSLYRLLRGLKFQQEHPEEAEKLLNRVEKVKMGKRELKVKKKVFEEYEEYLRSRKKHESNHG